MSEIETVLQQGETLLQGFEVQNEQLTKDKDKFTPEYLSTLKGELQQKFVEPTVEALAALMGTPEPVDSEAGKYELRNGAIQRSLAAANQAFAEAQNAARMPPVTGKRSPSLKCRPLV